MATTDKYDRQLRLWGANGQRALGETTVVLFRATAAGTETLKNLVLPGIGQLVIVDDADGTPPTSNFFVSSDAKRAQVSKELLQELNPDVKGDWKHVSVLNHEVADKMLKELVSSHDKLLVVAADLEPPLLEGLSRSCHEQSLPLVVVQSYGLIGLVRVQAPPLVLMEPKPDNEQPDLRLVTGFESLHQMAVSIDWDSLTSAEYSHVPYPFILIKAMESWKSSHSGKAPSTFDEKKQFRQSILEASKKFDNDPLNFAEAMDYAYLAYTERTVDKDHLQQLKSVATAHSKQCSKLLLLLNALETFVDQHNGQVPLAGNIPDMVANTDSYVKLQGIYQQEAAKHLQEMKKLLPSLSEDEVTLFCKNIHCLDVIVTRTLSQEYSEGPSTDLVEEWSMALMDPYEVPEHTPLLWYVALRGCRLFYTRHNRYPGTIENYKEDVPLLQECIQQVASQAGLADNEFVQKHLDQRFAEEMTRFANAEIHNVASVVGGVASQEAVKLITGQYVPLNNTFVYNGIAATGAVYEF